MLKRVFLKRRVLHGQNIRLEAVTMDGSLVGAGYAPAETSCA